MSPKAQRIAIAKICGWKKIRLSKRWEVSDPPNDAVVLCGIHPLAKSLAELPDYPNDLNAMHNAEITLSQVPDNGLGCMTFNNPKGRYMIQLTGVCGESIPIYATALQRAEAFLKTKGKWVQEFERI